MPLFEVAILLHPTKKQGEEGAADELIFGPKAVVANDGQSAAIVAVMENPPAKGFAKDRMEVLVRPFA